MNRRIFLAILSFCLLSQRAHALNVQNLKNHFPGGRGVSIIESAPRAPQTVSMGFGFNYALKPLEFGNSGAGVRIQGVVDHLFTLDFGAAYSFSERVMAGLSVPMHITHNIQSLTNFNQETVVSLGDVMLTGLYNILPRENSAAGFGLSVAPFLTLPSGSSGNFVGDSNVTGGFLMVADLDYNDHYAGLNLGFRFRKEESFLGLRVAQEMLYRVAYNHFISQTYGVNGFAEAGGSIVLNQVSNNSSPFEIMAGVSKVISEATPLTVKLAAGAGLTSGYGTPDLRALFQLSYDHILPKKPRKEVRPVYMQKVERELKELTIFYPTDGDQVDPFYDEKIAGIARIMNEHPELGPLYIIGHTDDVGDDKYNTELSERRARQALDSILGLGISQDRVISYGLGEEAPVKPNTTPENRALNRRTLFTFTPPAEPASSFETSASPDAVVPATGTDSYTETLKRKASQKNLRPGEYYKEDTTIKKVKVGEEEVFVDDEGDVVESEAPLKQNNKQDSSRSGQHNAPNQIKEKDLNDNTPAKNAAPAKSNTDDNFEESFDGY